MPTSAPPGSSATSKSISGSGLIALLQFHARRFVCVLTTVCGSHVATQYPVSVDFGGHKIKTRVDMVGWKPPSKDPFGRRVGKGAYVVIELKCTQHTLGM